MADDILITCFLCDPQDGKPALRKPTEIRENSQTQADLLLECGHEIHITFQVGMLDMLKKNHKIKLTQDRKAAK
jgi:hypothetical protein